MNLPALAASQLLGPWRIVQLRAAAAPEPLWGEATHLHLTADALQLQNGVGAPLAGTWHLQRHAQLGQPFLVLRLPEGAAQALITRLRRSSDGSVRQMVLYFQSGLELQLTHP
ncbi:hypothetical protein DLM85_09555 [Hymenobacter edaphi]|uniref:Lipocalin-like domain-containing protein n=1 Tax=Hymenobacter edaphi TaxID=2211146 RepID=A0A328BQQ8_9BACT|nr:hypothetical protein DLM85_09555 [Hymenobacter edaphi]